MAFIHYCLSELAALGRPATSLDTQSASCGLGSVTGAKTPTPLNAIFLVVATNYRIPGMAVIAGISFFAMPYDESEVSTEPGKLRHDRHSSRQAALPVIPSAGHGCHSLSQLRDRAAVP